MSSRVAGFRPCAGLEQSPRSSGPDLVHLGDLCLPIELHRSELKTGKVVLASISVNKVLFGRLVGGGRWSIVRSFARRGGEEGGSLDASGCWWLIMPRGSYAASLWRCTTATSSAPPSFMVDWRPLQPLASVTAISGRRVKVFINLLAAMPLRRPLGSDAVRSHLLVPSGIVPGVVEIGCIKLCCGRIGAGPDCFLAFLSKVLCANCKSLVVFSSFLVALLVKCKSTAECQ